jgi:hypothetical protein
MTMYARVVDGVAANIGKPGAARRLADRAWVMNLVLADEATRNACGIYSYEAVAEPDAAEGSVYDHTGPVYDPQTDTVTDVWTVRDKTQAELAAEADAADRDAKRDELASLALAALDGISVAMADPSPAKAYDAIDKLTIIVAKLVRVSV